MKDKVKMEYLRWVRRLLQSKLNRGNTIGAVNEFETDVSTIIESYSTCLHVTFPSWIYQH